MNGTGSSNNQYFTRLTLILILAAGLRGALMVYAQLHPAQFDYPDSHRYLRVARNIASGQGAGAEPQILNTAWDYPKTGTDPLYPMLLSAAAFLKPHSDTAIIVWGRIVNGLASMAAILILAALARRVFNEQIALVCALLLTVEPILLFFNVLVMSEWVYVFFLLAMVYALFRFNDERRLRWVVLYGIAGGLGTLSRSTNLWLPLIMFLGCLILQQKDRKESHRVMISSILSFLLIYGVILLPEIVRRYRVSSEIVLTRTGGGASLLEGLGSWADGGPGMDRVKFPSVPAEANEVERDRIYRRAALDWAWHHPARTLQLAFRKLARTWSLTMNAPRYQVGIFKMVSLLSTIPVFLLALLGIWRLRRRTDVLVLLILPAVYFSFIHMIFVGSVRYRLPAMPFVFILAAVGLCGFFRALGTGADEGSACRA